MLPDTRTPDNIAIKTPNAFFIELVSGDGAGAGTVPCPVAMAFILPTN